MRSTYFLAHPRDMDAATVDDYMQLISAHADVDVVAARDDYTDNATSAGTWDQWCKSVVHAPRFTTLGEKITYSAFVVTENRIGKATVEILNHAKDAGRAILICERLTDDYIDLQKISKVECVDVNDWKRGWKVA